MTGYNDYWLRVTPEIDYESFDLADGKKNYVKGTCESTQNW